MKFSKNNKIYSFLLIICLFSIGIGYAYINSTLETNLNIEVVKRRILYFDNVRVIDGSVNATQEPIPDKHTTTINFSLTMANINDIYSFYIDVKNDTEFRYMLSEIITSGLTDEQKNIIDFKVYDVNNNTPLINEMLDIDTGKYKVVVKIKDGISSITPQNLNLTLTINYVDLNETAIFQPYYYMSLGALDDSNINFNNKDDGTGIYRLLETKNDEFPVYYYRGNVNNKVIFNNICWNIVRTTGTRGVKLLYAGTPYNGVCPSESRVVIDGYVRYNGDSEHTPQLMDVGYMLDYDIDEYNNFELTKKFNIPHMELTNFGQYECTTTYDCIKYFYYTKADATLNVTQDGNSCKYSHKESDYYVRGWTDFSEENNILAQEELASETDTCPQKKGSDYGKYYIFYTYSNPSSNRGTYIFFYIPREDYNKKVYFGTNYIENEDGTYTLTDTISKNYAEWGKGDYSTYINMYTCTTPNTEVCDSIIKIFSTGGGGGYASIPVVYGTDPTIKFAKEVTYENGVYSLKEVINDYVANKETIIDEYHYSCLSKDETCEEVAYIYRFDNTAKYIILKNGEKYSQEMIEHSKLFVNTADSTIKTKVDSWYENNMSNVTDKIEDTIYCNDRSVNGGLFETNGNIKKEFIFGAMYRSNNSIRPTVKCLLKNDSFTFNPDIGNGKLTYPVGLLTIDEANLMSYAITSSSGFWTMSPASYTFDRQAATVYEVSNNYIFDSYITNTGYLRPVISLKYGVKFYNGDGTITNPYKIYGE